MPKDVQLLHNCTHFTCQQGNVQNPSSQASTVHELRTSRCTRWIQKRQRNQESNYQHLLDHKTARGFGKRTSTSASLTKTFDCVDQNKLWKILKEMGILEHLSCLLRNLYAGQEAIVRTRHGTTNQFKIEKGVRQGCILSPCLFNLYSEYII